MDKTLQCKMLINGEFVAGRAMRKPFSTRPAVS
jgi:hypothetical protein